MANKIKQEFGRITRQQEAIAGREAVAQPEQISDSNPWLERVEWAHYVTGYTFEQIIQ